MKSFDGNSLEVIGDDNLYGIGVRVGFYLQWAAMLFAYVCVPSKFKSVLNTITIFQLALFITLIWKTVTSDDQSPLIDIEAFLTLVYGVGAGLGSLMYVSAQNSEILHIRRIEDLYVNFITMSFGTYNAWFWVSGVKILPKLPYTAYVFFFSKINLHGWFINFNRALSTMTAAASCAVFAVKIWAMYRNWENVSHWLFAIQNSRSTSVRGRKMIQVYIIFGMILAFAMLVAVVELTIKWNSIHGVNNLQSTGQLIPLIIGLTALAQMVVSWWMGSITDG